MAGDLASDRDTLAAALQDRYHIERVLARGGMATVYVSRHTSRPPCGPLSGPVSLTGSGGAQLAVAQNGTVAIIVEEPPSLVFVNRAGASRTALDGRRNYHAPRFSPDGRRVALDFNSRDGRDVWIVTVEDGTLSRATFDRDGHDAVWLPDGRFITYTSTRSGTQDIYRKRPGGANIVSANPHSNYDISPDGKTFVMVRRSPATRIIVIQNLSALVRHLQAK